MSAPLLTRRRVISIAAAATVLPRMAFASARPAITWRGIALGAEASLTIEHDDAAEAREAIEASLAEVARLEAIFSLSRSDSALARLNRDGLLDAAPLDMRVLLAEALHLSAVSEGAFDPTIQPLWALYAAHFAQAGADPGGPSRAEIAGALGRVGWQKVLLQESRIRLAAPGMAVTLNGIAQGYVTDRVGDILKARGLAHVLVDMGEQLALGPKGTGAPWRVGIADPQAYGTRVATVELASGAAATSGTYGFAFDAAGRFPHLLDPRTGAPARALQSVTVLADSAARADGLSTALSILPEDKAERLLRAGERAYVIAAGARQGTWIEGRA